MTRRQGRSPPCWESRSQPQTCGSTGRVNTSDPCSPTYQTEVNVGMWDGNPLRQNVFAAQLFPRVWPTAAVMHARRISIQFATLKEYAFDRRAFTAFA